MRLKHFKIPLIIFCSFALLVTLAPTVHAQSLLPECVADGRCTLCDIMQLFINVGKFLLGIVGSLALLMFVYGGFVWLTSGGEAGKIDAGKKILVNSVIGVAITFFAWAVVAFVVTTLTASNTSGFNWQAELTCAPLPTMAPPVVENRNTTSTSGKEGESCTGQCGPDLFCNEQSKCQKKMGKDEICDNKTYAKIQCLKEPVCVDLGWVLEEDACISGDCAGLLSPAKCTQPAAGQGIIKQGDSCTKTIPCAAGLYCRIIAGAVPEAGVCVVKAKTGDDCSNDLILNSWLTGSASDMCNYKCDNIAGKCVYADHMGPIGAFCTKTSQCRTTPAPGLSCACAGAENALQQNTQSCNTGICTPKIPAGNTKIFCDGWSIGSAVTGEPDDLRCETFNCVTSFGPDAKKCGPKITNPGT